MGGHTKRKARLEEDRARLNAPVHLRNPAIPEGEIDTPDDIFDDISDDYYDDNPECIDTVFGSKTVEELNGMLDKLTGLQGRLGDAEHIDERKVEQVEHQINCIEAELNNRKKS